MAKVKVKAKVKAKVKVKTFGLSRFRDLVTWTYFLIWEWIGLAEANPTNRSNVG